MCQSRGCGPHMGFQPVSRAVVYGKLAGLVGAHGGVEASCKIGFHVVSHWRIAFVCHCCLVSKGISKSQRKCCGVIEVYVSYSWRSSRLAWSALACR